MKKTILASLVAAGTAASALAQGTVIFENSDSAAGAVRLSSFGPYAAANSYTVALLWAPGNTLGVAQSAFTQIGIFGLGAGTAIPAGLFFDGTPLTTGAATAPGTVAVFEVQGWLGAYTSYSQGDTISGTAGQSPEFLNGTGGSGSPPVQTTGWDGNLLLVGGPEPSTLAIGGLGAGVWLYFRRKKN